MIDNGVAAFEKLLSQLADVPTAAGPTPRQLQSPALVQFGVGTRTSIEPGVSAK